MQKPCPEYCYVHPKGVVDPIKIPVLRRDQIPHFIVASVPGTGTHFLMDFLLKNGHRPKGSRVSATKKIYMKKIRGTYFAEHCSSAGSTDLLLSKIKDYPVIVPMRNPLAAARTTRARGQTVEMMVKWFRFLIDRIAPTDPAYLPVDSQKREEFLAALNERFGVEFTTDWAVVRGGGERAGPSDDVMLTPEDVEQVQELMTDPFFERFGYD